MYYTTNESQAPPTYNSIENNQNPEACEIYIDDLPPYNCTSSKETSNDLPTYETHIKKSKNILIQSSCSNDEQH